jgi:hypothetical protein
MRADIASRAGIRVGFLCNVAWVAAREALLLHIESPESGKAREAGSFRVRRCGDAAMNIRSIFT